MKSKFAASRHLVLQTNCCHNGWNQLNENILRLNTTLQPPVSVFLTYLPNQFTDVWGGLRVNVVYRCASTTLGLSCCLSDIQHQLGIHAPQAGRRCWDSAMSGKIYHQDQTPWIFFTITIQRIDNQALLLWSYNLAWNEPSRSVGFWLKSGVWIELSLSQVQTL